MAIFSCTLCGALFRTTILSQCTAWHNQKLLSVEKRLLKVYHVHVDKSWSEFSPLTFHIIYSYTETLNIIMPAH